MLDIEKDGQKQDDISTNSNSENDFKELDNEIDKVIRGEASFEEEKIDYNSEDDSNYNKKNLKNTSKFPMKNDENKNLEKNTNLDEANLLNYLCQTQENILALEQYKKNLIISLINKEKTQFNNNNIPNNFNSNINLNINNNISQNDLRNILNNSYYYNNMNNIEINNNHINNNINQNMNYMNNSYLNELISLYNYSFNKCIDNNKNQINNYNINSYNYNNDNCINSINVNNININNNLLNNYNNQEAQENILNNNKLNYMNNLNHNYDSLLPINLRMNLFNNNYFNLNDINSNLLLLNQINNKNNLCININNTQQLNNISNLDNNHSQIDFNCFNINNNEIIQKNNNNLNSNNINKPQKIKSNKNNEKNGDNYNFTKKKINNQKTDLDINKNIINLSEVFLCKDKRTTLMIKNIPNKYTISSFLEEININFKFTYDIFYLPIDYVNKCNLGFAFINFVEPFHIILFYELYRGKKWKKFNSDKICELLYAKFQGKKELIAHFEKGKVLSMESKEKRPLILPTPNPLPKINLPYYYLELFIKIYPNISYEIKECKNKKNNNGGNKKNNSSGIPIFSIKGNFNEN